MPMPYNYNSYQQMYPYQQYTQPSYQQPAYQQTVPQQTQQIITHSSIVNVRNENEARNYPVAPGNSITFKDENTPYIYVKTMGFNQLDSPSFERFKLVKEDIPQNVENASVNASTSDTANDTLNELRGQIEALQNEYSDIYKQIEDIKTKMGQKTVSTLLRKADDDE
jgi:hypothetical protein